MALALRDVSESDDHFGFSVRPGPGTNACTRGSRACVLTMRVVELADEEALLASDPGVFVTEPHYNGFPAVLVGLPDVADDQFEVLIGDAWRIASS